MKRVWNILFSDIHQSFILIGLCLGIIVGAILAVTFRINYFGSPIWIGLVIAIIVIAYLCPKTAFIFIALIAGMLLMFFRVVNEFRGEEYIKQFYDKSVIVSGVIKGDPETEESTTKLKLTDLCFGEETKQSVNGALFVSLGKNNKLSRGDEITLAGKMTSGFGTYSGYLYKPIIKKWKRPKPGDLIMRMRNWFADRIKSLVQEPQVNLGLSCLLGMKAGLPDDLDESLRTVGLVHIVVASGAHLSILVGVAKKIFGKISRLIGLIFSVLFILIFMCMVGWTPSILRAGIMTIISLVVWFVGRKIAAWRLILVVAAITLMFEPMFLIDLGWLLSFASYAGIMIVGPGLTKFFYGNKKPDFVGSIIITTLAATLMTLPIVLYYYGTFSLISLIANLLILPTLPWAMGLVFANGVFAGIPVIETIVAWCAERILDFHILVVDFFGGLKQFQVKIEPYQIWVFSIYVVILLSLVVVWWRKKRKINIFDVRV